MYFLCKIAPFKVIYQIFIVGLLLSRADFNHSHVYLGAVLYTTAYFKENIYSVFKIFIRRVYTALENNTSTLDYRTCTESRWSSHEIK